MLWEMLSFGVGFTGLATSVLVAQKAGLPGIVLATFVGIVVGVGVFAAMRQSGRWLIARMNLTEPDLPPLRLFLSYALMLSALVWAFGSAFLGMYFSNKALERYLPSEVRSYPKTLDRNN